MDRASSTASILMRSSLMAQEAIPSLTEMQEEGL